jgi:mannose-6-phosphate isomerase-like protein (cupin superfamily)
VSVFTSSTRPPTWCELETFDVVNLAARESRDFPRRSKKERVIATTGNLQVVAGARTQVIREGQFLDLAAEPGWQLRGTARASQAVLLRGRWGDELGGCGIFTGRANEPTLVDGDPVDYPKNTGIDSHYHDCDEYWLILEGKGTAVVGRRFIAVGPGDCIPIGMGHHHDMPTVESPVKAVYFETTLEGRKRTGHLWNHTHGPAEPRPERV